MERIAVLWKKKPRETPGQTLERYGLACADQFDEDNATDQQKADVRKLIELIAATKEAHARQLSCRHINFRLYEATECAKTYIKRYNVTVPPASN